MNNGTKNLDNWYQLLQERFSDAPREAARYYNLQILPRLMHKLDESHDQCPQCNKRFVSMEFILEKLPGWLKADAPELSLYEEEVGRSLRHLERIHGIYPKGKWLSMITIIGMIIGIVASIISYLLIIKSDLPGLFITGTAMGLLTGWGAGKIKEKRLKSRGRIF